MKYNPRIKLINNLSSAEKEIEKIGADPYSIKIMASKMLHSCIKMTFVEAKIAHIIKQEMLAIGGDAAVSRGILDFTDKNTDVILMGTHRQYGRLIKRLKKQPFDLSKIGEDIEIILKNFENNNKIKNIKFKNSIKNKNYNLKIGEGTLIMGILNVSPDSFYDGGRYDEPEKAVERAKQMVSCGADIIDVGGESTRPGSDPVSLKEELNRTIPVIEAISSEIDVPISIDTYKSEVAEKAIQAGASIINDISGLGFDEKMAEVAAEYDVPVVIMHIRGTPGDMQKNPHYDDVISDILAFFRDRIKFAIDSGIDENKIIIDPGIGFGKTVEHNLEIIKKLREFKILGKPILIGTSRKSFIGFTLEQENPGDRLEGTLATVAASVMNGADIVRVHDVKECGMAAGMIDAIVNKQQI